MRRWLLAVAMGWALCMGAAAKEAAVPVPMVGAVDLWEGKSWIALAPGQRVQGRLGVVTLDGAYHCCYTVGGPTRPTHARRFSHGDEALEPHVLKRVEGSADTMVLGVAVPAQDPVAVFAIPSGTQFTWRGRSYRLTQCASAEGVHVLLDGQGRRLRHYYYHLDFDTDPDCDPRVLNRPEQPS